MTTQVEDIKAAEGDEEAVTESPVLGRRPSQDELAGMITSTVWAGKEGGESRPAVEQPVRESIETMEMDEAVDRGFEAEQRRDMSEDTPVEETFTPSFEVVPDFTRSVSRGLPPVREESPEEVEDKMQMQAQMQQEPEPQAQAQPRSLQTLAPLTPEANRDSGFVDETPHPFTRNPMEDGDLYDNNNDRDSNLREARATTPQRSVFGRDESDMGSGTSTSRKLRRSPLSRHDLRDHPLSRTPALREPSPREATPEPQKVSRRTPDLERRWKYGDLGASTSRRASPGAAGAAAIIAAASASASAANPGRRSVSDQVARLQSPRFDGNKTPTPSSPSPAPAPVHTLRRRSASNTSLARHRTPEPLRLGASVTGRADSPAASGTSPSIFRQSSATPPLRRVDKRVSGDLRRLSQRSHGQDGGQVATSPAPSTLSLSLSLSQDQDQDNQQDKQHDKKDKDRVAEGYTTARNTPVANEGRVRAKGMADVYDGYGEGRIGSPRSPTRPHSMRRRQSMQVLELEARLEQLVAENRALAEANANSQSDVAFHQRAAAILADRDAEIDRLKRSLDFLQKEVNRLTEVNDGLNSANAQLATQHNDRERDEALARKDAEMDQLRSELDAAKDQIRQMQQRILASKPSDNADFLSIHDVDYFDHRCQQLCSHVQQWVLRFSKFSDMRACRLTSELNDEKVIDRLDNAVLDGSDVDVYLADRVRRRDIFMSMTMNMIWEFVFTRYLFGMDREQRQKLKSLEKLLTEVGPAKAVRQWRAVTLTLLSRRAAFREQRELDTEAVVQAVFQTLSKVLPPPSNLELQIQSQLRRVMREAVDLAIEMRTQRAEYVMLPPLQPTYDEEGELAETVTFNAALMNERSGGGDASSSSSSPGSNEELEARAAVVRVVLFPLVVKKGDDSGEGDDEIVVSPAQVLVARSSRDDRKRGSRSSNTNMVPGGSTSSNLGTGRLLTPSSDAGGASLRALTATNKSDVSMRTEGTYQGAL
ncbi:hypothetical protein SODALDRAFT_209972 [Sodiomyces alkalinus F11]|uniref:Involucrin repeat protein n=1 Tax=Sodiomyces alkalinus (strain CBS 110278 / VKM F-3762 / F11) TaxID=1314773 RepID=A0A3N2PQW7_SODAK|nr:hypothetical protein SODALDRAFT_209972 [Sodiomyces alkalinus F11]ROT36902.1 hypothetical protein SODALDRAFT_209972 [Sodiomyces alkalinus F11]